MTRHIQSGPDTDVLLCACGDILPLDRMYLWQDVGGCRLACANCCVAEGVDLDQTVSVDIALLAPAAKRIGV